MRTIPLDWAGRLGRFFAYLRRYKDILWAARVPVVLSLGLTVAFTAVPQTRDAFRAVLQDTTAAPGLVAAVRLALLAFVTFAGAGALWYWCHQCLNLKGLRGAKAPAWIEEQLPRLCAVVPVFAMGCMLAGVPADEVSRGSRFGVPAVFLLGGGLLYGLLYIRKRSHLLAWSDTPRAYNWMGIAGATLAVLVFGLSLGLREYAYQFGPIGILWLGAAFWCTWLSAIAIHGMRHRIPWLLLLALCAGVVSLAGWSDNHEVRHTRAPSGQDPEEVEPVARTSVVDAFKRWKQAHPEGPVTFVAAEGGGIYAAYHAGYALARLQEETGHEFGKNVFMISSVSGGSVGSGIFLSLLAAETRRPAGARRLDFVAATRRMLDDDLLSPVLAAAVGPDALQLLLPFSVPPFDRARALEDTLEKRWIRAERVWADPAAPGQRIDWSPRGSYWDLWLQADGSMRSDLPGLFLNTTNVETGGRAVLSPYAIPVLGEYPAPAIAHLWAGTRGLRIPLPTAIVMSARFPIVTPVARLDSIALRPGDFPLTRRQVGTWRFGDGGYFENSGIDTMLDVVRVLQATKDDDGKPLLPAERVRFLVIQSIGDTIYPNGEGLSEYLAPVRTLIRTRTNRADLARARLAANWGGQQGQVANSVLFTQRNSPSSREAATGKSPVPDIPLGWMLSASSEKQIRDQVDNNLPAILEILLGIRRPASFPAPVRRP